MKIRPLLGVKAIFGYPTFVIIFACCSCENAKHTERSGEKLDRKERHEKLIAAWHEDLPRAAKGAGSSITPFLSTRPYRQIVEEGEAIVPALAEDCARNGGLRRALVYAIIDIKGWPLKDFSHYKGVDYVWFEVQRRLKTEDGRE